MLETVYAASVHQAKSSRSNTFESCPSEVFDVSRDLPKRNAGADDGLRV